jgi:hypothetical protein
MGIFGLSKEKLVSCARNKFGTVPARTGSCHQQSRTSLQKAYPQMALARNKKPSFHTVVNSFDDYPSHEPLMQRRTLLKGAFPSNGAITPNEGENPTQKWHLGDKIRLVLSSRSEFRKIRRPNHEVKLTGGDSAGKMGLRSLQGDPNPEVGSHPTHHQLTLGVETVE